MPRDRDYVGIGHVVRTEEIDVARACFRCRELGALFVQRPSSKFALPAMPGDVACWARMPREKCGVGEEVSDPLRGERLLEARRVRALRQPDARRIETGEAARRAEADPELRPDRRAIE